MTKIELEYQLIKDKISKDWYSLDGGLPNEQYCLNKTKNMWEVYYSERGNKSGLKKFNSESVACAYLYFLLAEAKAHNSY